MKKTFLKRILMSAILLPTLSYCPTRREQQSEHFKNAAYLFFGGCICFAINKISETTYQSTDLASHSNFLALKMLKPTTIYHGTVFMAAALHQCCHGCNTLERVE